MVVNWWSYWDLYIFLVFLVVDVYQEWCGPCKAMTSIFRRIKNEIGDDLLHFAVVSNNAISN